jgi:MFS family permease
MKTLSTRKDKLSVKLSHRRYAVRKSLKLSVLDGAAYAAMLGLIQNYVTPLALALKATTAQVGLLSSIPSLVVAFSQLAAPDLSERAGTRKRFILPMVFLHAVMYIPILLIPFIFQGSQVWWLIAFVTVSAVLGAISNPAWGSLMADLVPIRLRGRYFSARGRIAGIIMLGFSFVAGGILQVFMETPFIGFAMLFGGAAAFRLLSFYFLSQMYEPESPGNGDDDPSLLHMVRHVGSSNLGRFTVYTALILFAANVASPFFSVYMLRDLGFNYVTYTVIISSVSISSLVFLTFWGRRADLAGNIKVIRVTSWLLPVIPLLWLASYNIYYLIFAEIVSGFAWSGFNLAAVNFIYDASEDQNRTKHIAVFNTITSLAICAGALIGGFLAPHLPALFGYKLRTLFTISGVMRGLVVIFLLRQIIEVRRVPGMTLSRFLLGRSVPANEAEPAQPRDDK